MSTRSVHIARHQLPQSVLSVAARAMHERFANLTRGCYGYEEWSTGPPSATEQQLHALISSAA